METQVTTVKQLPLNEVMSIGKAFAESGISKQSMSVNMTLLK
jgi:hypothetical protein